MRANLQEPLTSEQATQLHECSMCKELGDGCCEHDCVLSATCSLVCTCCGERVYFTGSLPYRYRWEFNCPYCGAKNDKKGYRSGKEIKK